MEQLVSGNCSTQAVRACSYHDLTAFIMQKHAAGMWNAESKLSSSCLACDMADQWEMQT